MIIIVRGDPAPQGSKKFVGMAGGRGLMVESSKRVKPWRQDVVAAAREADEDDAGKKESPRRSVRMTARIRSWEMAHGRWQSPEAPKSVHDSAIEKRFRLHG